MCPQSRDPSPAEWRSEHTESPRTHKHLLGSVAELWLLAGVPLHLQTPWVWDRLVLMVLLPINSASESLCVQSVTQMDASLWLQRINK